MTTKTILAALLLLCANVCIAQDTTEATYPGGLPAWKNYLNHHLHYPDKAISDMVQGDIVVQFMVDEQGNTSDYKALTGPKKGGLREEAIRVIRESGKWTPAIQNGKNVRSFRKETISFKISVG